ncbi:MAG: hypothetical protein M3540_00460 [Actinomycetota bacterium]|nr:hypothetical protein [Actinomycetota bacterium]
MDIAELVTDVETFAQKGAGSWRVSELKLPALERLPSVQAAVAKSGDDPNGRFDAIEAGVLKGCRALESPWQEAALDHLGFSETLRKYSLTGREDAAARKIDCDGRTYRRKELRDGRFESWRMKTITRVAEAILASETGQSQSRGGQEGDAMHFRDSLGSAEETSLADALFSENYVHNSAAFKQAMRSTRELSIMGFAHNRMSATYASDFDRVVQSGGKLHVLAMDPEGHAVLEANTRSYVQKSPAEVRHQHEAAIAVLRAIGLKRSASAQFELKIMDYIPPFTIYLFDESDPDSAQAFVWLTPWRAPSSERPGFRLTNKTSPKWFEFFAQQLRDMWQWEGARAIR